MLFPELDFKLLKCPQAFQILEVGKFGDSACRKSTPHMGKIYRK